MNSKLELVFVWACASCCLPHSRVCQWVSMEVNGMKSVVCRDEVKSFKNCWT